MYQMVFVPRAELDQIDEGHIVAGARLEGSFVNITDRFVSTVNGLVALNESEAAVLGCFYTYDKLASQVRFSKINFIDCGPADDWKAPLPPEPENSNNGNGNGNN